MVASSVYILDRRGKPLIFRNYRNDLRKPIPINQFFRLLSDREREDNPVPDSSPLLYDKGSGSWFLYMKCNGLFFVACCLSNSNVFVIYEFLSKFIQTLTDYFEDVQEESIKDNFVLVYELLDEMLDYGYPQITESKVLKEYITQEGQRCSQEANGTFTQRTASLASQTLSSVVNWRPQGLRYQKNEVYVDVIESLSMLLSTNGSVVHSEISGVIRMKCLLSGMPEVKIGLNERLISLADSPPDTGPTGTGSSDKEQANDMKFHTCVRLANFEKERIITFVPPDGEFDLLTYRVKPSPEAIRPLVNVHCGTEAISLTSIRYHITASMNMPRRKSSGSTLEILVPVPPDTDTPRFTCSLGRVKYLPESDCLSWKIKHCPTTSVEFTCTALLGLPTVRIEETGRMAPIRVLFEIPYYAISGAQVKYLKVVEKSGYETTPWVRYLTRNGEYQVRMPEVRRQQQSPR